MWQRGLCGRKENYLTTEDFRPKQNEAKWPRVCVCALKPSPILSYSNQAYILGNKEKPEKIRLYFYISISCVVYWSPTPPNMPFQRRWKCIFYWCGWAWLTIWDRVKILRYSRRQMHRKRVSCELHDSYFRLMTIKHAIPKTVEVTHSDGQLWGDSEWEIELLYNSVKTGS